MSAPKPGTPEHNKIVTASKVAAIVGVSPWASPRSMWHTMRNELPEVATTAAMARGNYLEAGVIAWWKAQHPEVGPVMEQHYATLDGLPWAAATLDALALTPDGPVAVEVKTASRMDGWGTPGTDEIPTHYLTQVYWQLAMCPEAVRAYVAVLGPFLEFSEYVVERDEAIQADLIARCRAFYESLSADVPPELDDSVATFDVIKAMHPDIDKSLAVDVSLAVAAEFLASDVAEKAAKAHARLMRSQILDAAGDAQYVTANGQRFARRQPNRYGISLIPIHTADLTGVAA